MATEKVQRNQKNSDEIRIVLIGKTGVGKSAAANTILGENKFYSDLSASSVTTECNKDRGRASSRKVAIIDTPGLFDTQVNITETEAEIKMCISMSAPGPHVFLIVVQLGRFTLEEINTVDRLQKIFGESASKYTIVLFTHGDMLKRGKKTIHQFVKESPDLHNFIMTTSGRYHVFDNAVEDPNQVDMLFELIDQLIIANGETYYTNNMLQEAEIAIEEEKTRLMQMEKMREQEARESAERNNKFLKSGVIVAGVSAAVAGAAVAMKGCSVQ